MKPSNALLFLPRLPCSYCSSNLIELLCLVIKLTVEDEWWDPLMIGPLLTIVVLRLVFF
jgi:hypothetical protein